MSNINKGVPNANDYYPLNSPEIGTALGPDNMYPQNKMLPALFTPLTIRGTTFKNRIWAAPMCQYSSRDGHATDWHFVHIGGFATRGVGAICLEATSVVPEGRISPEDAGLWTDSQIKPLKRIVDFAHAQGTKVGIQLGHAGRKSSTLAPWVHSNVGKLWYKDTYVAQENEGGWPDRVPAPSAIAFSHDYPVPKALTLDEIKDLEDAFAAAVERSEKAGFDFIEIHCAHGYLFHEFLSPLSNVRTDAYGGSIENRMRFPLDVIKRTRQAWSKPLFVRISVTDWAEMPEKSEKGEWAQWGIEQSKLFVEQLVKVGVDLVDCSSGGNWQKQKITVGPGYQVPFSEELKKKFKDSILIGAVGLITNGTQAEAIVKEGKADVVSLARELLRDPHAALTFAKELGVAVKAANQYERAWVDIMTPKASKL